MIRRIAPLILTATLAGLEADADPWLRPGIPLRVTATLAAPAGNLTVWIEAEGRRDPLAITRLGRCPAGRVTVHLVPLVPAPAGTVRIAADGATVAIPVRGPGPGPRPAGAAGLLEDLRQERLSALPASLAVVQARAATSGWSVRADRWGLAVERRWPVRAARRTVLFLHPQPADHAWWPGPPPAALAAAETAGAEIIELHPFGSDGGGVLAARVRDRSAAVDLVLEWGPGLAAAAAQGPVRTVATAEALSDPAAWMAGAGAAQPGHRPLPSWAEPGIVLVVGTGEHDAARRANAALAEAFAEAWRRHAGGAPERTDDRTPADPADGRTRILFGTPASHREAGPFRAHLAWDHRTVALAGSPLRWHRSEERPIQWRLPDPRRPDRWLILLTGRPAWESAPGWRPGRLPLHGLPEAWIGPAAPGGRPGHAAGGTE